jgi:hypothetical protein
MWSQPTPSRLAEPLRRGHGRGRPQDLLVDVAQPWTWFRTELGDDSLPHHGVPVQCFCGSARVVQCAHELSRKSLGDRILRQQVMQFVDDLPVIADRQFEISPFCRGVDPELLELVPYAVGPVPGHTGQRCAVPLVECLPQ